MEQKQNNAIWDVIVVGGGTAGVFAALAAAEAGCRTALIEQNGFLGGMLTSSGLTEMNAAGFQGQPLYGGLEESFIKELIDLGAGEYKFAVPMTSNPDVKVDRFDYNPTKCVELLQKHIDQAKIKVYLNTRILKAQEETESCSLTIRENGQDVVLTSKYIIDATGKAAVVALMNKDFVNNPSDSQMIATQMFRLSGVKQRELDEFTKAGKLAEVIKLGLEEQVLKGKILCFAPIPGTDEVSVNATRAICRLEDEESVAKAKKECLEQIDGMLPFIKTHIPALNNAEVVEIAPVFGIRDTRAIKGRYTLKLQDLSDMVDFEDAVAWGCYPMDMHDPITHNVIWQVMAGVYSIPFRSMMPLKLNRVIAAGKCIGAEHEAFAAFRVMPIVINMGESAGLAAAMAVEQDSLFPQLDGKKIKRQLLLRYKKLAEIVAENKK